MTRGILLIALGHQSYTSMARTLAASLKCSEPEIQIVLATDRPIDNGENLFDSFVHIPEECYTVKGETQYIKAKTHMYDLSPFDETIFLDVDMIILEGRKISDLFEQLKEIEWTMANTGPADKSLWAEIIDVREAYKTQRELWNYHSEFVYFKKKPSVKKYFDKAKAIYNRPKIPFTDFGGGMADELAFQIASMLMDYYPHQQNFLPTYWWARGKAHQNAYIYQLPTSFYSYSIGGNAIPDTVKRNYNNLASFYFNKMNLQRPYQAKDKRSFLRERIKL